YIRNSVKVVTDAYNGTTTFYLSEPDDPLALTLGNVFPGLLKSMNDMPAALRQHVRYPEDIFAIQASIFATFHMTNPLVFYAKEDRVAPAGAGRPGSNRHTDASVLHGDEAPWREPDGVHPDAAVHAAAQEQPLGVARRAQRRQSLRPPAGVRVPE